MSTRSIFGGTLAVCLLLAACGGQEPPQSELRNDTDQDSTKKAERLEQTRKIFYNIPSPMETATLLKKAGAEYDKDILNDVLNVDKYTAASKQALNLGVYGADLSYASVNNQTQESMFYTSCAKKLADKLGVSNAFNDSTLERMEKNMNNRDSLLHIISETYWNVDAYLKENERDNISALMIAGGWVEGLYIATQLAGMNPSAELEQRIAEQKLSLGDLIALVSTYPDNGSALTGVKDDLAKLQALYDRVQTGGGATDVTQENGVTVIGGGTSASLTKEQFTAIHDLTARIRNSYIN
ncbi:MAG: hypothetical protein H6595_07375 [Flavobacteriales bacterium]|nr:hypothetical protein [Flavobacteriales bacterium]MCB9167286.1 hypothetical protein [Flavobacteriales bacterium]